MNINNDGNRFKLNFKFTNKVHSTQPIKSTGQKGYDKE